MRWQGNGAIAIGSEIMIGGGFAIAWQIRDRRQIRNRDRRRNRNRDLRVEFLNKFDKNLNCNT